METKELPQLKTVTQNIELVKGEFNPSEAAHVISCLINEKINFHKLQRLQLWEGDHCCKTNTLDGRIDELENGKEIANQFINSIRGLGKNLTIKGTLEISLAE